MQKVGTHIASIFHVFQRVRLYQLMAEPPKPIKFFHVGSCSGKKRNHPNSDVNPPWNHFHTSRFHMKTHNSPHS